MITFESLRTPDQVEKVFIEWLKDEDYYAYLESFFDDARMNRNPKFVKMLKDIKEKESEFPYQIRPKTNKLWRGRRMTGVEYKKHFSTKGGSYVSTGIYKSRVLVQSWSEDRKIAESFRNASDYDPRGALTPSYTDVNWNTVFPNLDRYQNVSLKPMQFFTKFDKMSKAIDLDWNLFNADNALGELLELMSETMYGDFVVPCLMYAKIPIEELIFNGHFVRRLTGLREMETVRFINRPLKVDYHLDAGVGRTMRFVVQISRFIINNEQNFMDLPTLRIQRAIKKKLPQIVVKKWGWAG